MRNAINLLPASFRRQQLVRKRALQWSAIVFVVLLMVVMWLIGRLLRDRRR